MSFQVDLTTKEFKRVVEIAARAADTKGTAAMAAVRLVASGDGLALLGMTNTCGVRVSATGALVGGEGVLLLPAALLAPAAKALAADMVTIAAGPDFGATLRSGKRRVAMPGQDPDNWPQARTPPAADAWVRVPHAALALALARVGYAASANDTQPHMSGVRLEGAGGRLAAVGVDGHRLAVHVGDGGIDPGLEALAVTLPRRAVEELGRLAVAPDGAGWVEIATTPTTIFARGPGVEIACSQLEGLFPAWRGLASQFVPRLTSHAVLDRATLAAAARALAEMGANSQGLALRWRAGVAELAIRGEFDATVDDEVAVLGTTLAGDDAAPVGVNATYLAQALDALPGALVRADFGGPDDPIVLRAAGEDAVAAAALPPPGGDGSAWSLVMAMRSA